METFKGESTIFRPLWKQLLIDWEGTWKDEAAWSLSGFNCTYGWSDVKLVIWLGIWTEDTECILNADNLISGILFMCKAIFVFNKVGTVPYVPIITLVDVRTY